MRRREILCSVVASGVGLGIVSGAERASAAWDVPIASTRGQFYIDTDCGWLGVCGYSQYLRDEYTETEYEIPTESPSIPWDEDHVFVFCHGYNSDSVSEALDVCRRVQSNFREPWSGPSWEDGFAGYIWDSAVNPSPQVFGIAYEDQETIAYRNGKKAANFVTDLQDTGNTDTKVHWVAHSMGGHVTFGMLEALAEQGRTLDTVMLYGPAVPREFPNYNNYGSEIEQVCEHFDVLHTHDDFILEDAYKIETGNDPLGARGAKGTTPPNYEDHDVTASIGGHKEYTNTGFEGQFAAMKAIRSIFESFTDTVDGGAGPIDSTYEYTVEMEQSSAIQIDFSAEPVYENDGGVIEPDTVPHLYVTLDGRVPNPETGDYDLSADGDDETTLLIEQSLEGYGDSLGIVATANQYTETHRLRVQEYGRRPGLGGGLGAYNVGPTARISLPDRITGGETFRLDGSASTDPDDSEGTGIVSATWTTADAGISFQSDEGLRTVGHVETPGDYTVSLTVTDADGATDTATASFTAVENVGPTAQLSAPSSATVGETVSFDATGSTDPDDNISTYEWYIGGADYVMTGAQPTYTFDVTGTFDVQLTVTDSEGLSDQTSQTLEITDDSSTSSTTTSASVSPVQYELD